MAFVWNASQSIVIWHNRKLKSQKSKVKNQNTNLNAFLLFNFDF
jgi:hypothetical protein